MANSIVAPDGQTTEDAITSSALKATITQTVPTTIVSTYYTFSVWLKTASGTQTVSLSINVTESGDGATQGQAKLITSQWERYKVTLSSGGVNPVVSAYGQIAFVSVGTIHAWGAQLESNQYPGVYVKTTSSQVATNTSGFSSNKDLITSGKVGIGILSPVAPLDVYGAINGSVIPQPTPPYVEAATAGGRTALSNGRFADAG